MDVCEIVKGSNSPLYCKTHETRMGGCSGTPKTCFKLRPLTSPEKGWLVKEQRRLGYRRIVGTLSKADVKELDAIQAFLRMG